MQQENITFNDMPQMLAVMYAKLNELGDKVDKLIPPKKSEEQQWFNVADLIEFCLLTRQNRPSMVGRVQERYHFTRKERISFLTRQK